MYSDFNFEEYEYEIPVYPFEGRFVKFDEPNPGDLRCNNVIVVKSSDYDSNQLLEIELEYRKNELAERERWHRHWQQELEYHPGNDRKAFFANNLEYRIKIEERIQELKKQLAKQR